MRKFLLIILFSLFIIKSGYSADLDKTVSDAFELYSVGSYDEAAPMFEEAYYMAKKNSVKDISARFRTALYAGLSYRGIQDYASARSWFLISLALAEKTGDLYDIPTLLAYTGESYRMLGDGLEAEKYYARALNYSDLTGKDKAVLYYGLAESKRITGDYNNSKASCDEAVKYARNNKIYKIESSCDIINGEYYRVNHDYSKAIYYFGRAVDTSRARKYTDLLVPALNGMGLTSEALKRPAAAREYFEQALFVSIENGLLDNVDIISGKIKSLIPKKGNLSYQGDKVSELSKLEYLDNETLITLYNLASLYYESGGKNIELYSVAERGYELAEKTGSNLDAGKFVYFMSRSLYNTEEYEDCINRAEEALSRLKSGKNNDYIGKSHAVKSECSYELGNYDEAVKEMSEALKLLDDKDLEKRYAEMLKVQNKK